jgi:hypothetical protein
MNWSNYSALKSASKTSFVKQDDDTICLVSKSYDGSTGEELADSIREYSLSDLEREKERYDSEIARAKAQSDELAKAIADFKKV